MDNETQVDRPPSDAVLSAVLAILHSAPGQEANDPRTARLAAMVRQMGEDGRERDDPIREILARLGDKWSPLLILVLRAGPFRHATLRRLASVIGADPEISQRMLTLRLRSLERDGLVRRTVTPTIPPQVEYAITDLGLGLVEQMDSLMDWVRRHDAEIRAARERFVPDEN
ncbi:MAG TPA: helix-turn-helix domain-containing protein [Caulobacteraceae bacterium]